MEIVNIEFFRKLRGEIWMVGKQNVHHYELLHWVKDFLRQCGGVASAQCVTYLDLRSGPRASPGREGDTSLICI